MTSYFSVCSGIEAASVAWKDLDWQCAGLSEIEAFPRAVLKHHFPDHPLHGDFTALIDDRALLDRLADLDELVIVAGTPCQDFSIAGLRAGVAGDRGNLTLQFIRLANAIDDLRSDRGKDPCVILWENVPGIFSSGNDFGNVLAGFVGDAGALVPYRGRWTDAGMAAGPRRRAAWTVKDAQYFGLAQRRERVFIVASAREGFDPAAVLFEPEGVRRHSPPRREAREGTANGTEAGAGSSGLAKSLTARPHMAQHEDKDTLILTVTNTLGGASQSGGFNGGDQGMGRTLQSLPLAMVMASGQANAETDTDRSPSLTCLHEAPIVASVDLQNVNMGGDIAGTLDTTRPSRGGGQAVAFKPSHYTRGKDGAPSDIAPPLQVEADKGDQDPLVFSIMPMQSGTNYKAREVEVAQPLMAGGPVGGNQGGDYVLAFTSKDHGADAGEISPTLRSMGHDGSHANGGGQVAIAIQAGAVKENPDHGPDGVGVRTDDCAYTLEARAEVQAVAFPISADADRENSSALTPSPDAQGRVRLRDPGLGVGQGDDPMFTLQSTKPHAVAFESRFARNGRGAPDTIVPPLKAQSGGTGKGDGAPLVAQPISFLSNASFAEVGYDIGGTLRTENQHAVALPFDTTQITHPANRSNPRDGDPSGTLPRDGHAPSVALGFDDVADPVAANQGRTYTREGTHNFRMSNVALSNWMVRRLTPRECERLQGFPDDYTLVPFRNKPAADGPRYKALGNSMAVPCMRWLGQRIDAELKRRK